MREPIVEGDDASGRVAVLSPMRLHEDPVDLLEVDGLGAVTDGLDVDGRVDVVGESKTDVVVI